MTNSEKDGQVLIVTSVSAEREAVLRGLNGDRRFDVLIGGVGIAAAAASTATALAQGAYRLVVNAGIAGGFPGKIDLGSIVLADEVIAADLGAETQEGFCSLDKLGFGTTRIPVDPMLVKQLTERFLEGGVPLVTGPILSVSTVTGTRETAIELEKRIPGAVAEAMEGYGVAMAAQYHKVPVIEIRAISNMVGPRDRAAWRIKEALEQLTAASSILMEVL